MDEVFAECPKCKREPDDCKCDGFDLACQLSEIENELVYMRSALRRALVELAEVLDYVEGLLDD